MPFSGSNGHALAKCTLNLFGPSGPLAPGHMHGATWAQKPKPLASIGEAYAQRDRPLTVLQVAFLVSWHLVVVSVPPCGGIRLRAGLLSVHGGLMAGFCDL